MIDISTLSHQEVFDLATTFLRRQDRRCNNGVGRPLYREAGRASVLGFIMGNELYTPNYEGMAAKDVYVCLGLPEDKQALVLALENVHDLHITSEWKGMFHALAKEFELVFDGVDYSGDAVYEHHFNLSFVVRSGQSDANLIPSSQIADVINLWQMDEVDHVITNRVELKYYLVSLGMSSVIPTKEYTYEDALKADYGSLDAEQATEVTKEVYDTVIGAIS